ncbi:MAG TPA: hypothetical protein VFZ33_11745 [Chitinophagaceae bacterium]
MAAIVFSVSAQKENISRTENFSIEGKVKKGLTVSLADLSSYKSYSVDSTENHKVLSGYYFVCIASDEYKVVFSWNEIFNSDVGKSVYIITGQDGNWAYVLDNRIALVSSKDHMTGRRYVKDYRK